jgi:hypothetical protein
MTVAPANTSSIIVAITGVLQDPSTYSVSGTTLTFSAAPPSGTSNISVRYLGIPASGVTTTAYRTVTNTTATSGQTSFTIPSYTVGYVDVYRNGVYLPTSDYTATTGTTVVLNNGATVGDTITTISFYVSSVLNAIPATAASINQSYLASGVAGTGPAFSAYKSAGAGNQSITSATYTKVTFDTEEFDTNSNFASSTFTPTVAGYYQVNSALDVGANASTLSRLQISIYKNGGSYKTTAISYGGLTISEAGPTISTVVYCNGSTDYVEIWTYAVGTSPIVYSSSVLTWFSASMVRAA